MLGAAEELAAAGFEVDAQQNRQMSSYVPVLEGLRDSGQLGTIGVAVVHLGTNGSFSDDTAARFFGALSSVPRVVVLTIRADRSWTVPNNDKIYNLPNQYPNVQVLDWGAQSNNVPWRLLLRRRHPPQAGGAELLHRARAAGRTASWATSGADRLRSLP